MGLLLPPNQGSKRRKIAGGITFLYVLFTFLLSSIPGNKIPLPNGTDYLAHILEFAILSFLASYAVFARYEGFYPYPVFSFSLAVGLINEIYQIAIPFRTPSLMDLMADAIGAFLGIWIFALLFEKEWINGIRNKIL